MATPKPPAAVSSLSIVRSFPPSPTAITASAGKSCERTVHVIYSTSSDVPIMQHAFCCGQLRRSQSGKLCAPGTEHPIRSMLTNASRDEIIHLLSNAAEACIASLNSMNRTARAHTQFPSVTGPASLLLEL